MKCSIYWVSHLVRFSMIQENSGPAKSVPLSEVSHLVRFYCTSLRHSAIHSTFVSVYSSSCCAQSPWYACSPCNTAWPDHPSRPRAPYCTKYCGECHHKILLPRATRGEFSLVYYGEWEKFSLRNRSGNLNVYLLFVLRCQNRPWLSASQVWTLPSLHILWRKCWQKSSSCTDKASSYWMPYSNRTPKAKSKERDDNYCLYC